MRRVIALGLAIGLDAVVGDPPNTGHPVAWLGRCARAIESRTGSTRADGALAAASVTASAIGVAWGLVRVWPRVLGGRPVAEAGAVWVCTGRRSLLRHAIEVADALDAGDLAEAQRLLSFHLVSRDT
ncbi:MAG: cobalamin biosynthesis protein, partial [Dehalococcoidia bacterium]